MIIQICQDQPEIALCIVQPGCTGQQLIDAGLRLVIRRPDCYCCRTPPILRKGCWLYNPPKPYHEPHELPALVYDAFEVNDEGLIVFRLDDLFFEYPPGRYSGTVELKPCSTPIVQVDIDLCSIPFVLSEAQVTSKRGCE